MKRRARAGGVGVYKSYKVLQRFEVAAYLLYCVYVTES